MHDLETIWAHADALATVAAREYDIRRKREKFIATEGFGEPGWDMLLDLFTRTLRRQSTRVTSACIASCSPGTTGLRYLKYFVKEGLIVREASAENKRVVYVHLSEVGLVSIGSFMMSLAGIET